MRKKLLILIMASAVLVSGCANDPNRAAKRGAGIGAVVGGILGHQVDDDEGKYVGAVVGALAGGAVGHYMDKQRQQLEKDLAKEAARGELQITEMADGESLRIGVASDASFDVDSATLKPEARSTFSKIATVLKDYDKTIVHVVGHTDSDGSDSYNQALSERRANAVDDFMVAVGLSDDRTLTEGRGEKEPIASNATVEGKRKNRRVDIVIKPVVEGREESAYTPPPYLGS